MSERHLVNIRVNHNFHQNVFFGLVTRVGTPIKIEGVWEDICSCKHEDWQKHLLYSGLQRLHNGILKRPLIQVELLSPGPDPFYMATPGWFHFRLHIPSCLPLKQIGMHARMKIPIDVFE